MKIFVIILISILVSLLFNYYNKNYDFGICKITKEIVNVNGMSMEPLIKNYEKRTLLKGYYNCPNNQIQRNDIIVANINNQKMIVKIIKILPNDNVMFSGNNIYVNGEILINSENSAYNFTKDELSLLNVYIKYGKMESNMYYLLGDNLTNSIDSKNLGPITKEQIYGKIETVKH